MDIYEAIYGRKTVRDFQDKEIAPDIIRKIIDAGLHAPTNNHMREWEFIIISDKTTRLKVIDKVNKNMTEKEAIKMVDDWGLTDHYQREMYIEGGPKQYRMLLTAGCLMIPCFYQNRPLLTSANLSGLNRFASVWCCIENILLAAANEGVFGVTRIPFDEEIHHIREVLKIPENYQFPCYIALGYLSENIKPVWQHPMKAEERLHFNQW